MNKNDFKDYRGKIVKVFYLDNRNEKCEVCVIVFDQKEANSHVSMNGMQSDGRWWQIQLKQWDDIIKITSARLSPEVRKVMQDYYKAKVAFDAFEKEYQKKRTEYRHAVDEAQSAIKTISGTMDPQEFAAAAKELFRSYLPVRNDFHRCLYVDFVSVWDNHIVIAHTQEIEKYAKPEEYSFIRSRYDRTLYICDSDKAYKKFCDINAPIVVPKLARLAKNVAVKADIGDKDFLTVSRCYTFRISHGTNRASIEELRALLAK